MAARLVRRARADPRRARASLRAVDRRRARPSRRPPQRRRRGSSRGGPRPRPREVSTLATPRHALATHRPVSFAAVACRASSSPDSRFHPPEDDDDDVDALDDDDDEDAFVDDDFDIADVPFLVGEGGADGPTEVGVDVLIVDENGGPPSTDDDAFSVDALAAALEEDARALVRWLVDPPPNPSRCAATRSPSGSRTPSSPSRCAPTRTYADSTANGATRTRPRTSSLSLRILRRRRRPRRLRPVRRHGEETG